MNNDGVIEEVRDEKLNVTEIVIKEFPKTLYRFRTCSSYNIKAFMYDEVWLSKPVVFNDPYDFTFVLRKKDIQKGFNKYINNFISKEEFEKEILSQGITEKKYYDELLKNFIKEQEIMQKNQAMIGCFSTRIDNEIMWGHYSDNSTGFALEYSFDDLRANVEWLLELLYDIENNGFKEFYAALGIDSSMFAKDHENAKNIYGVFPVRYKNGKYNGTNFFNNLFEKISNLADNIEGEITLKTLINEYQSKYNILSNQTMIQSIALHKKRIWSYEHEWRIVLPNLFVESLVQEKNNVLGFNCRPVAIYLGENIESHFKKMLINEAKEKEIIIYQMETDYFKRRDYLNHRSIK
jgi:hypothetical protein